MSINNKLRELGYKPLFEEEKVDFNFFENLSEKIGYQIPEDYQKFLLDFPHTGTFSYIVKFKADGLVPFADEDDTIDVNLIYASCLADPSRDLLSQELDAEFYLELLPIASAPFGNYFSISLSKQSFGKIYFLDHEEYFYNEVTHEYGGIYSIADSFEYFIQGLIIEE